MLGANDVVRLRHILMDIRIDRLVGIDSLSRFPLARVDGVRGVSGRRRWEMMLKEHVVLVGNTTNTPEDLISVSSTWPLTANDGICSHRTS